MNPTHLQREISFSISEECYTYIVPEMTCQLLIFVPSGEGFGGGTSVLTKPQGGEP